MLKFKQVEKQILVFDILVMCMITGDIAEEAIIEFREILLLWMAPSAKTIALFHEEIKIEAENFKL